MCIPLTDRSSADLLQKYKNVKVVIFYGLYYDAVSISNIASTGRMVDELEIIWK
jgi:hypothetical protein